LRIDPENRATPALVLHRRVTHPGSLLPNIFVAALHKRTRCTNAMQGRQTLIHRKGAHAGVGKQGQTAQSEMVNDRSQRELPDQSVPNTSEAH